MLLKEVNATEDLASLVSRSAVCPTGALQQRSEEAGALASAVITGTLIRRDANRGARDGQKETTISRTQIAEQGREPQRNSRPHSRSGGLSPGHEGPRSPGASPTDHRALSGASRALYLPPSSWGRRKHTRSPSQPAQQGPGADPGRAAGLSFTIPRGTTRRSGLNSPPFALYPALYI